MEGVSVVYDFFEDFFQSLCKVVGLVAPTRYYSICWRA